MNSFPDQFDPTASILFLGSGFSAEATNILGSNPPVGRGDTSLEREFLTRLGMSKDAGHDLKDLATHAQKKA